MGEDNIKNSKTQVTIVGRNYGNLLVMARDVSRAGYDVNVLHAFKKKPRMVNVFGRMTPEKYSSCVRNFQTVVVDNDDSNLIRTLIRGAEDKKSLQILIPVDDYAAALVDRNLNALRNYFLLPSINDEQDAIVTFMSKTAQKQAAEKYGLPVLPGAVIKPEEYELSLLKTLVYPCFIKPDASMKGSKALMRSCRDVEELRQVLKECAIKGSQELIVEEYADIKAEYSLLGMCINGKSSVSGVFRTIVGGHKERKGVAAAGEIVLLESFQEIIDKCNTFIESIGYTGMFDIDLLETKAGHLYFVEMNFRAGASAHVFSEAGINLPGIFLQCCEGRADALPRTADIQPGTSFVSEKILLEEYINGDISRRECKKMIRSAGVQFIYDKCDKKPYQYFRRYVILATILKIPYRIKFYLRK